MRQQRNPESPTVFRVVREHLRSDGGLAYVDYFGPYATHAAAKAIRTREENRDTRTRIQTATTVWEDIE